MDFFVIRIATKDSLDAHIKEELTGVKIIIESGHYDREDVKYL